MRTRPRPVSYHCATDLRQPGVAETQSRSASAATSPRPAATAAAAATPAAAPAAAATAATATPAATPPGGLLLAESAGRCIFLVEHIEGRQADIGHLFLAEEEMVLRYVLRRHISRRRRGRCMRCTGHGKRYTGDSQNGNSLISESLRRLRCASHSKSSHTCGRVAHNDRTAIKCATPLYARRTQPSKRAHSRDRR